MYFPLILASYFRTIQTLGLEPLLKLDADAETNVPALNFTYVATFKAAIDFREKKNYSKFE